MDKGANFGFAEQLAAALDWWRDAGVDAVFADQPENWVALESPAQTEETGPARISNPLPEAPKAIDRSGWPTELAAFAPWWLTEPWLDDGPVSRRVAPRGQRGAQLMVLVAEPEKGDEAELLAGPHGRLVGAMLSAMGIPPGEAYVASVLPRHTPHADWGLVAERGLGDLAKHHVALAAPQRLIVFGTSALSLLGHDPANFPAASGEFQHEDCTVPFLAARDLAVLLERPRWKAGLWQKWLDWTEVRADVGTAVRT